MGNKQGSAAGAGKATPNYKEEGVSTLSIGPNCVEAQELVSRALDFENENETPFAGQVFDSHPPDWLIFESALYCTAAYEADFAIYLSQNASKFTKFIESGSTYDGKFWMVEYNHPTNGEEYLFVVFRAWPDDLDIFSELIAKNGKLVNSTQHGAAAAPASTATAAPGADNVHQSSPAYTKALSILKNQSLHPSFLLEYVEKHSKNLVITGHGLGGVQASLLTARLIREFRAHSQLTKKLLCVTYGSPLVGDETTSNALIAYKNLFYHYILDNDVVPMSHYIPVVVSGRENRQPGKYYLVPSNADSGNVLIRKSTVTPGTAPLDLDKGRASLTNDGHCRLMHNMDLDKFNSFQWKGVDIPTAAKQHKMFQYFESLANCSLLSSITIDIIGMKTKQMRLSQTTANPTVKAHTEKLLKFAPLVRNVYLTGFELEIEGDGLACVNKLLVNGKEVHFSIYSSNSIIGRLDKDENLLSQSTNVNITLGTIFRNTVDEELFDFLKLPLRLLGNSKVDMFPNELIASILPFTSLMLADDSLKTTTDNQESIYDLLRSVDKELKKIESSIPAEFAFNMMTRDVLGSSANNTADATASANKHMKRFLKRLREVEVIDWSKLCSTYMLRVLREAIDYLPTVLEEDKEIETALKDAFSAANQTNGWFDKLYVSTFDGFCEQMYCANQALSNRHFWDFVYKKSVKVGVTFTYSGQTAFEYIPFNEPYRLKTAEGIVLIEKESSETTKENAIIFTTKYRLTIPGVEEPQSFLHFEIFKNPGAPETKLWLSKITSTIAKVIIQTKSELRKSHINSILVQSFDNFTLSTWFTYTWFLQYEREWPDVERIGEINRILAEQIPIQRIENFLTQDFQAVHDEILKGIESTYGFNIGLYFTKHPKRKVLVDLKLVREEMLSNHYSVSPPFFSGLAVDFEVKDSTQDYAVVPFFNFIPKAVKYDPSTKWEEVLHASQQVTDGLEFILIMLDRYVLLTRQELYQIKNTIGSRAKQAAIAAVQLVPAAVWSGYQMALYLGDRRFNHVVNVEQRFRRMYDKIMFSEQQVASYKELLMNLISLLDLDVPNDASIEMIEDVLYYSIPSAIGKYSLADLMIRADEIFTDDVPVYARWKELLNPRSKAVHLFIMKQILHCHRLRMIRSKYITIAVNGQKNSGKSTLVQKVCGESYLPHIVTGENPKESTIFPTGYRYPYDLPNHPPAMIIDLPGCTDADTENIVSLFCDCVDVSIFMIYAREAANFNNSALKEFLNKFILNRRGPSLICINGIDNNLRKYPKLTEGEDFEASKAKTFMLEILTENRLNWNNSKALNLPRPTKDDLPTGEENPYRYVKPYWEVEGGNRGVFKKAQDTANEGGSQKHYWLNNNPYLNSVVYSSGVEDGLPPLSVWLTSLEGLDNYPKQFGDYIFQVDHIRAWIQEVREYCQGWKKNETFSSLQQVNGDL